MAQRHFHIHGKLITSDKQPLSDLRIEAWDKDLLIDDFVGEAISDEKGGFKISFSQKRFKELFFDARPDIYFKVYSGAALIHNTEKSVLWNIDKEQTDLEIVIDREAGITTQDNESKTITFSGHVIHTTGNAVEKIKVLLNIQLLRDSNTLAETITDTDGHYSFGPTNLPANTAYTIESVDDSGTSIASSGIIFEIADQSVWDLTVSDNRYKGDTVFAKRNSIMEPYFRQLQNSGNDSLSIEDVYFIANQTKLEPRDAFHWLRANGLETETKIPAEAFYGMFKASLPTDMANLSAKSGTEIKEAIREGAAQGFVSDEMAARADDIVNLWNDYISEKVLDEVPYQLDGSLGNILNIAIKDKSIQKKVLTTYLSHEGSIDTFWAGLGKITGDKAAASKIQVALQLGSLTANQPELAEALASRTYKTKNIFHELAAMDNEEWVSYINDLSKTKKKSLVPSFIQGNTDTDRINAYAGQMATILAENFPTYSFFGKLAKQDPGKSAFTGKEDLLTFFANNPSFDIRESATVSILTGDADLFVLDNIKNKEVLVQELQSIQRLSAYTNDFRVMNVLKTGGMDTALNIVRTSEASFINSYSSTIGSVEAAKVVYLQAEKKYMTSAMMWANTHTNLTLGTTVTPDPVSAPTIRTMFGTLDTCECEHCTSVFSPAAYYTDILNFLYSRTPDVYAELFRRREDLMHINLNCENTNTPLPYVDLVNELLESFVSRKKGLPVVIPSSYQTTWQSIELAANPEHTNYDAYGELKKAVFPCVLPFNLPVEEARVYLKHLSVEKHELMSVFFSGTEEEAFDYFDINMERLNITFQEGKILSGETTGADDMADPGIWNFYGFDKATGFQPLTDPADSGKQITGSSWDTALTGRVDVFLQQTGLLYKELLTLFLCNTINPITGSDGSRGITITSIDGDNSSCELANLQLNGITNNHLQKIHRFLRLSGRLQWDMFQLDKAIFAFGLDFGNDIDLNKANLCKIAQCDFLAKQLKLPVEKMLAFWSDINTASYIDYFKDNYPPVSSLYEKLFSNKAVSNPVDPAFELSTSLTGILDDTNTDTIVSALQISDEDYTYLKAELTDTNLTLANLSELYRHALMAKKLKLSIKNFLSLKKLIGTSADAFTTPLSTFSFLLKAEMVKVSGFSIDQLNYILCHDYLEETSVAPTDDTISIFLSELRSSLRAIETGTAEEQQDTIIQKFSEQLKITTTAAGLLLQTYVKAISDSSKAVVEDFRSDSFSGFSFLQTYTDTNGIDFEPVFVNTESEDDTTTVTVPDLFSDYMRLDKIATVINKMKLSDTDIETILVNSTVMQCADLALLPVTETAGNLVQFEILVNLIRARDTMPVGSIDFFTIVLHAIDSPDKSLWLTDLVARTNWDKDIITAFIGVESDSTDTGLLNKNFPTDFSNGETILRIKDCLATLSRIGLSTSLIQDAVATDFDSTVSDAIKNAVKAKYDEPQWLKLAKPLRDSLREKQREALVAFVIASASFDPAAGQLERWKNSDELYEYLLIDVEMKPISMTSRIKQAICSVQLFIDRVLMNLEHTDSDPSVAALKLEGDQVEEWKEWRRIYRVWEANRKIFLYPENWLEPELRDDKSPFFKELEVMLKQNELTNDNVEDAFHAYLNKLDEVARLEVVGMYHQIETGLADENDIDILHVFARTYANPYKYFHRTLENSEWTAWQKLEIDVDGGHIVPAIFNRKLCLFWLFFTPDSEESSSVSDEVPRFWKIQSAWSEFRKNKWTAKRLSTEFIQSESFTTKAELDAYKRTLVLRHWIDDLGNDFASSRYDGKLHLYLNPQNRVCYIDGIECSGASFVFDNTNTDPDVISEEVAHSFLLPDNTDYNQQMVKSEETGTALSLRIEETMITSSGFEQSSTSQKLILNKTSQGRFKLVTPANELSPFDINFFFQDKTNTFFVTHSTTKVPSFTNAYSFGDWHQGMVQNWGTQYLAGQNNIGGSFISTGNNIVTLAANQLIQVDTYFREPLVDTNQVKEVNTEARTIELKGATVNIHGKSDVKKEPVTYQIQKDKMPVVAASNTVVSGSMNLVNSAGALLNKFGEADRYTFNTFYHAHVKDFVKELYKNDIEGLLSRDLQVLGDTCGFVTNYDPTELVTSTPSSMVDFTYGSAYAQYNWELFFHVPMLVACRLKDDQRFEEARDWFHYVFNPTNSEGGDKERFWQFKPFYDEAGTVIETLDDLLKNETELTEQVEKWMDDPFKPHVIARMRISAYMKNVVMKYLDNLVAWGDNLFRRDSIEAINEATNLYILAAKILGERPQEIPPRAEHEEAGFDDIKDELDAFSNAMVQIETMISSSAAATSGTSSGSSNGLGEMFYFCVPRNEYLMKYWDLVADRLFKIRHSMNIEGVVRMMPLFEPPIDPAMLVRAAAAGMDLSSILSDMNAQLPNYRFSFMLQKAHEFANEVKALGGSMLQALEKRDAESLALLRSAQEQKLLSAALSIKEKQVEDTKAQLEGTIISRAVTQAKFDYYNTREFTNNYEKQQLDSIQTGMLFSVIQGELNTIGGVLAAIPNLKAGAPTSMGVTWGGDNLGAMMNAISTYMGIYAAINSAQGSMAGTLGSYTRRMDDWKFQAASGKKELEQLDKQVLAGEIRLAVAEKEVLNQQLQIESNSETDEFMRSKFSSQELYDWMIGQLSTVYFQSYQLVYDLAKKAEQCYQYELGEFDNSSFVQFGYWDSLKKGLLSAEKLQYDLRRMESAYYESNSRELELTKHISLLLLDPQAILDLRKNGTCGFVVSEAIFDLDFQGHYFRRIKSVSVSIPCIAGPYTSINATLQLQAHTTRINTLRTDSAANYKSDDYSAESDRFRHVSGISDSIATSSAQNDSGMFELSFRDERYLPFEGCGAISVWQLELNTESVLRMFDYDTISDIIVTMRYTATEDNSTIKTSAAAYLTELIGDVIKPTENSGGIELMRMFSLKQEFSTEWHKCLFPAVEGADQLLTLTLKKEHFPFFTQKGELVMSKLVIRLKSSRTGDYYMVLAGTDNSGSSVTTSETTMAEDTLLANMQTVTLDNSTTGFHTEDIDIFSPLVFKFKHSADTDYHSIDTNPEELSEICMTIYYNLV